MEKQISQITEFHTKFKQEFATEPTLLSGDECDLRHRLGAEELNEYFAACIDGDKIEILDALADQLYILLGTVIKHGFQDTIIPAFELVHANNMNKLGPDGEPILRKDGKILKPEGFQKVELSTLFQ